MSRFDLSTVELFIYPSLVTEHEMQLYTILTESLDKNYPNQFIVYPKVKISDIIRMKKTNFDRSTRGRYQSRHFDFVICSKENLQPILAIELQDKSHKTGKGRYIDLFKKMLCDRAGLQFLQLWTTNAQNIKNLLYYRLPKPLALS